MENFSIIRLNTNNKILILIKTCESPFEYIKEISDELSEMRFDGTVIIDELLHSGNNFERFITCKFQNDEFQNDSFSFYEVPKQNILRKYICDYLKMHYEFLDSSGLSSPQINLIKNDCII